MLLSVSHERSYVCPNDASPTMQAQRCKPQRCTSFRRNSPDGLPPKATGFVLWSISKQFFYELRDLVTHQGMQKAVSSGKVACARRAVTPLPCPLEDHLACRSPRLDIWAFSVTARLATGRIMPDSFLGMQQIDSGGRFTWLSGWMTGVRGWLSSRTKPGRRASPLWDGRWQTPADELDDLASRIEGCRYRTSPRRGACAV